LKSPENRRRVVIVVFLQFVCGIHLNKLSESPGPSQTFENGAE
jgi:hypothetical protein